MSNWICPSTLDTGWWVGEDHIDNIYKQLTIRQFVRSNDLIEVFFMHWTKMTPLVPNPFLSFNIKGSQRPTISNGNKFPYILFLSHVIMPWFQCWVTSRSTDLALLLWPKSTLARNITRPLQRWCPFNSIPPKTNRHILCFYSVRLIQYQVVE